MFHSPRPKIVDVASEPENVALNLYDFFVRRPKRPAEKYGLRAYDEIILAPMVALVPVVSCLQLTCAHVVPI